MNESVAMPTLPPRARSSARRRIPALRSETRSVGRLRTVVYHHSMRSQHGGQIRRVYIPVVPEGAVSVVAADPAVELGVSDQFRVVRGRSSDVLTAVIDGYLVRRDLGDGVDGDERMGMSEAEEPAVLDQQEADLSVLIVHE